MKVYSVTRSINAAPETIWGILMDGPSYVEWDPRMERLEGSIAPGETIKVFSKLSPGRAFPVKVTEFTPNIGMKWSGGMPLGLFKGERTFTLTSQDDGATEFTMREVFSGLLQPLIGKTIPDLGPSFEQFADGLKSRAESTTSS